MFEFYTVLLTLITVFIGIFWHYYSKANYWKNRGVNGPKSLLFFGNATDNFFMAIPDLELKRYKEYGRVHGCMEFTSPVLTVGDPELIKLISIKDFHIFPNRLNRLKGDLFFAKLLLFMQDDDWRRVRMIMSSAFTSAKLKRMFNTMNICVGNTLEQMHEIAEKGKNLNLKILSGSQAFDTITRCALGLKTNPHKDPENIYMRNMERFLDFSSWRFIVVLLLPWKLQKILGLQQTPEDVLQFFEKSMASILDERRAKKVENHDFLQFLLDAESDEAVKSEENKKNQFFEEGIEGIGSNFFNSVNVSNKKLTTDEILAQSILLMLAGYHTTAVLLSYGCYCLAIHPNVQEKLYSELSKVFKKDDNIDYESLNSCTYLDAFVSEALRYYPPVVTYDLVASQDYKLPNGLVIEKGVRINFPSYAIHHDPEFYENPHEFKPERFFPENRDKLKPCTFLPFGSGPRHCIGLRFAVLEAKIFFARLVLNFKFSKTADTKVPPVFISKTDMSQCEPLFVGIERRQFI